MQSFKYTGSMEDMVAITRWNNNIQKVQDMVTDTCYDFAERYPDHIGVFLPEKTSDRGYFVVYINKPINSMRYVCIHLRPALCGISGLDMTFIVRVSSVNPIHLTVKDCVEEDGGKESTTTTKKRVIVFKASRDKTIDLEFDYHQEDVETRENQPIMKDEVFSRNFKMEDVSLLKMVMMRVMQPAIKHQERTLSSLSDCDTDKE